VLLENMNYDRKYPTCERFSQRTRLILIAFFGLWMFQMT